MKCVCVCVIEKIRIDALYTEKKLKEKNINMCYQLIKKKGENIVSFIKENQCYICVQFQWEIDNNLL